MKKFRAGIINADNKGHIFASGSDLTEQQVGEAIRALAMKYGTARIDISPEPEVGPYCLKLYAEDGRYLVTLDENGADGEFHFRTMDVEDCEDMPSTMHGEYFPNWSMTKDIDLVARIFMEFYRTGDVSKDLLPHID
jgi:hypothetical protein